MRLPIDEIRPDFERQLDESRRLVVTAETGAGKSTRIPVWLAERFDGLILVVEPRRIACHALAEFLAAERGEKVGAYFGSRVRFSDRSGPDTRVLFCTPGVALRMLAKPLKLGALVVDEFHERSWQVDLVVAAATSLQALGDVPLILTSATIDAESAAAILGATTLHATGRTFPVEVQYASGSIEPSTDAIGKRVADAVTEALAQHDGEVLAFLPGMKEIRAVETALGRISEEVLIVHGSQPPEAMRRVFQKADRRRVYLATNVAETSITLPGVRIVIDSGLAKTKLHRAGRAVLATTPISDASMQQRAGRAGRIAPGVCIRLWSERFRPDAYQRPEIERVELDDLLLQAAELGLVGDALNAASWITPPPAFAVERAVDRLRSLDALDVEGLTTRGRALAQLPVSAEEAALLVGAPKDIAATACDLVAILQARGSFLRDVADLPGSAREAVDEARLELLQGVTDEVTTGLLLLRDGSAKRHHLSRRWLDEARTIARQLRDLTGARGESLQGLAEYIVTRLPAAGFVLRPRASRERGRSMPWANGAIEVQVYAFQPVDHAVELPKYSAAVILETDWVASVKGIVGIGRMILPTAPSALADAGLGEATLTGIQLEKKSGGRVKISAARNVQLAGVTLATGEVELRGHDLHRAVAELVLENRLFKGARDALRDALHGWRILAAWRGEPLAESPPITAPEQVDDADWLTQRIATLGVEISADLQLIERDDLVPNLETETGIPSWEFEQVLKHFPRVWTHQGGRYSCAVRPESRRVHLEPLDAKARKIKEPVAASLPRFHGFGVTFQQGSRRLSLR
ncbi:MAG: ATP-dependent helicase HrpB [Planctomycetota bacterium]|jgi:ATP-dependent helicase HrpB